MSWSYRPAVREKIGLLFGIAGPSGSGKTRTALHLAKGIANGHGAVAVIDTEAGRALHYGPRPGEKADSSRGTFDFFHVDFPPPFTPERYIEAIKFATENGATVVVIDSMSHEWAGEGGLSDVAASEAERMAKAAASKSNPPKPWEYLIDTMTAPSWSKPKRRHKRMMGHLIQCRSHLIFCLRAEEKVKMSGGKVVPIGFQPICEKGYMYELSGSMMLHPERPGRPDYNLPHKLNDDLQQIFPHGQIVGDEAGKRLRQWAESGVDRPAADRVAIGAAALIERVEDAADIGALTALTSEKQVIEQLAYLRKHRSDLADRVEAAIRTALAVFDAPPVSEDDDFPGDKALP